MSNVNLILGELSKKKVDTITLPFSNKSVKVEKPTFKFQEDIIRIFEKFSIIIIYFHISLALLFRAF